ncbi:MAG TPA: DUF2784 domain-containing protein [Burkholderiales bacterium]
MLADLILLVHFALAAFIVLGLPLAWIGAWLGWNWTRNRTIRYAHAAAILVVAAEALAGSVCPLTRWEDALRAGADGRSFIGRWFARLLYYDFPEWAFTLAYVLYALATLATLRLVAPRRPSRSSQ